MQLPFDRLLTMRPNICSCLIPVRKHFATSLAGLATLTESSLLWSPYLITSTSSRVFQCVRLFISRFSVSIFFFWFSVCIFCFMTWKAKSYDVQRTKLHSSDSGKAWNSIGVTLSKTPNSHLYCSHLYSEQNAMLLHWQKKTASINYCHWLF